MIRLALMALFSLLLACPALADLAQGKAALQRQDYQAALNALGPLAQHGQPEAQHLLGDMFANGWGAAQNYAQARHYYTLAADQGYAPAQCELGLMFLQGRGVRRDAGQALPWLEAAAEQNLAEAQFNLGMIYYLGQAGYMDVKEAYKWLKLAEAQKYGQAGEFAAKAKARLQPGELSAAEQEIKQWRPISARGRAKAAAPAAPPASKKPPQAAPARKKGNGTGFIVSAGGHVLTNFHVIKDARLIKTPAANEPLKVVAVDQSGDLALLLLSGRGERNAAVFRNEPLRLGESIMALGYPLQQLLASELNVTMGAISSLAGLGGNKHFVQISAPVQPGNSGGPILDEAGLVVGVVTAKLDALAVAKSVGDLPQNINFAVNGQVAVDFLKKNQVSLKEAPAGQALKPVDVVEQARGYILLLETWR